MKPAQLLLTITGAAVVFLGTARAESENPKAYELKNRSSFHADADARIPFWPIGWKRPVIRPDGSTDAPRKATKFQIEPANFSVTSVLLGNPALATINGRSFGEGEVLPVVHGSERLRVVLRAIRDGGVALEYEGQQIFVPMKRPELGSKRGQQKADPVEFTIKVGESAQK
ncbi:MAG: hypothetical protein ABI318_16840 [Chthoniobacteraceae bacterium]